MMPQYILAAVLAVAFLALVFIAACVMGRARRERWWQCAWCQSYFNEGGDVSNVPPSEPVSSHGCCDACKKNTLKEYQMRKALK